MPGELIERFESKQGINQAAVTYLNVRRLHQTLADIGMIRG